MEDFTVVRLEPRHARIRNVPIAVTPEGFWCCPSPAVLQKTLKAQSQQQVKQKGPPSRASSGQKVPSIPSEKRNAAAALRCRAGPDDLRSPSSALNSTSDADRTLKPAADNPKHKISVGFGQPESSDLKVILHGKDGVAVKMSVHKNVLGLCSSYFADKLSAGQSPATCVEMPDCEDVEIYVETVGLMYCKDVKPRLIKQTVPRVLRILKAAQVLGFRACVEACLDFLEAVPWVGDEEENVVSSIKNLRGSNYGVSPLLKRVSSDLSRPPNDTFAHILDLVLKSGEDKGRREMKALVLKLLKENSSMANASTDIRSETLYRSCQTCLLSLVHLFRQASASDFADRSFDAKDPVMRQVSLVADNLLWLVEILVDRHIADDFAVTWASQDELASLHSKVPITSRHLVSCITARIFVAIGKGEMLPHKDTRHLLLNVWLQPLIDDYCWLQHGCRSFDRKVVEEGIGRTILTLPLEDQQTILLSWLGSFLKVGDNCPNLHRAFEVWWRRTFVRPYTDQQQQQQSADNVQLSERN